MRNPKSFRFTSWLSEYTFFRLTPHRSKAKIPTYRDVLRLTVFFLSLSPLLLSSPAVVNAQWEPDRRLTFCDSASWTTSNYSKNIVAGVSGLIHIVWEDWRDDTSPEIYYKRSSDFGSTWSQDIRLTYARYMSKWPSIFNMDSKIFIVWTDDRDNNFEIYIKRSTDSGMNWGQDVRLSYDANWSLQPSVSASDSLVYVVWSDNRDRAYVNEEIYYRRSSDFGQSWSAETRLTFDPWESLHPSIGLSDSLLFLIWNDNRDSNYEIYYKQSSDAGLTWSNDMRLTNDAGRSDYPSIFVVDAMVHVVWNDDRDGNYEIYYKRSTDLGINWSQDLRLTEAPDVSFVPFVVAQGSNVHLVWLETRDGNGEIYYKCSHDFGATWSQDIRLTFDDSISTIPSMAISDTIVHVIWTDARDGNKEIYYKRNPTGNSGVEEGQTLRLTPHASRLRVSPNPFSSFTALPGRETERFMLYDISGRWVGTYRGDRVGADLTPGVYFLVPERKKANPLRIVKLR
jgi:hypothetical protein